jgi:hypothetical protein
MQKITTEFLMIGYEICSSVLNKCYAYFEVKIKENELAEDCITPERDDVFVRKGK